MVTTIERTRKDPRPISEAQKRTIRQMCQERGIQELDLTDMSVTDGRLLFNAIKTTPRQQPTAAPVERRPAPAELQDGMYILDGTIYKVQHAVHGSGRQYAKRLIPNKVPGERAGFVYAPGVVRQLTSDHRMTREQAQEFGALYGTCCQCGAVLTDEDSIERGMGPVCAGKI